MRGLCTECHDDLRLSLLISIPAILRQRRLVPIICPLTVGLHAPALALGWATIATVIRCMYTLFEHSSNWGAATISVTGTTTGICGWQHFRSLLDTFQQCQ